jgi:hypothetical protein
MSEVSDASNTSSAPEASVTGVQLAPSPGRLRRLGEAGASSDSHTFDDRILTISPDASLVGWLAKDGIGAPTRCRLANRLGSNSAAVRDITGRGFRQTECRS